MRKFTLMIGLVGLGLAVNAQEQPQVRFKTSAEPSQKSTVTRSEARYETVYWSENFDKNGDFKWAETIDENELCIPAKLPATVVVGDNTNSNYFWHWTEKNPRGTYTAASKAFDNWKNDDKVNGAFVLEMDYLNKTATGGDTEAPMDSYVQFGPIDLSAAENCMIIWNQTARYCCGLEDDAIAKLQISTDYNPSTGTGTWKDSLSNGTQFDLNIGFKMNIITPAKYHMVDYPIGELVDGQKNVYIRYYIKGNAGTNGMSYYWWLIDNIRIVKAPEVDLVMDDYAVDYADWAEELNMANDPTFGAGFTAVPLPVVDTFTTVRAKLVNKGTSDLTVTMHTDFYRDDVLVAEFASAEAVTVKSFASEYTYTEPIYQPDQEGTYQMKIYYTYEGSDKEYSVENNTATYSFTVGKQRYSRVNYNNTFGGQTTRSWTAGGGSKDRMAMMFNTKGLGTNENAVRYDGIRVFISNFTDSASMANGLFKIKGQLFINPQYTNSIGSGGDLVAESDSYTLQASDRGKWVVLPFNDEDGSIDLGLEGQLTWASIELEGQTTSNLIYLGTDNYTSMNTNKTAYNGFMGMYFVSSAKWSWASGRNLAIELWFDDVHGVSTPDLVADQAAFRVYPNPTEGTVVLENVVNVQRIVVSNLVGQEVMSVNKAFSGNYTLDMSSLNNGVYMISVIDANNNVTTKKVMKQ